MSLNVTIPDTFNGPLDLLLHLIRRDEMDIYDIPIGKLATSYLEEIRRMEIVDVEEGAEFLDLASRLLEIKSRMLVPVEEQPDDPAEEEEDFDPRTDLVESLLEYRRFKDAAKMLGDMAEEQARRYPRIAPRFEFQPVGEEAAADSHELMQAFQNMLIRMVPRSDSNVITYTEVPTRVRIEQIETVLREIGSTRFSKLLSGAPDRREMVGFFIAMLEMIRQGRLVARQSDHFSDILLERRIPAAPQTKAAAMVRNRRPPRCFTAAAKKHAVPARKRPGKTPAPFPGPAPARCRCPAKKRKMASRRTTAFP